MVWHWPGSIFLREKSGSGLMPLLRSAYEVRAIHKPFVILTAAPNSEFRIPNSKF